MGFHVTLAQILVRLGDALNALALRLDPKAWTRERVREHRDYMAYLDKMDWLREHADEFNSLDWLFNESDTGSQAPR